jgi:phosphoserine phosphatase
MAAGAGDGDVESRREDFRSGGHMIVLPAVGTRVAAFFDIDGTLLPGAGVGPRARASLERRFLAELRQRGEVPARNYFLWMKRAVELAPRGVETIMHGNKMYLRGLRSDRSWPAATAAARAAGFVPEAVTQAAWHGALGHAIVLVSGTLAPLAHQVAVALAIRLAAHGVHAQVGVCATRLQEIDGRWTGEIAGEAGIAGQAGNARQAMFGAAKARAIRRIAADQGFDLPRCYAYGDASSDRWMLAAVGRPAAVNPSADLESVARLHDWPVLRWEPAPHQKRDGAADRNARATPETETQG